MFILNKAQKYIYRSNQQKKNIARIRCEDHIKPRMCSGEAVVAGVLVGQFGSKSRAYLSSQSVPAGP